MDRSVTRHRHGQKGQNATETIILLPFFFMIVFSLLQMGQLGTALLVANYAASSIARQVVQDGSFVPGKAEARFRRLLTAGMKNTRIPPPTFTGTRPISNVTVHACAEVDAFPFVTEIVNRPLRRYNGACGSTANKLGPVSFNTSNRTWIVHGKATARMNYRP